MVWLLPCTVPLPCQAAAGGRLPRAQEEVVVLGSSQDSCECLEPTSRTLAWRGGGARVVCQAQLFSEWNQRSHEPAPPAGHQQCRRDSCRKAWGSGEPVSWDCVVPSPGSKPWPLPLAGRTKDGGGGHLVLVCPALLFQLPPPALEGVQCPPRPLTHLCMIFLGFACCCQPRRGEPLAAPCQPGVGVFWK